MCLNCIPDLRYKRDRQKFVIKTYSILLTQMAVTAFLVGIILDKWYTDPESLMFFVDYWFLFYFALAIVIVI